MTPISAHGNESATLSGSVLVLGAAVFITLLAFSAYSAALSRFSLKYEEHFFEQMEKSNLAIQRAYEIN